MRLRYPNKMDIEFEERLCEEVRRYPLLYNPTLKEYKEIQACNNAWREISEAVGREEILCRNKWKYLRDRFVKAKKKLRGRKADSGNVPRMFSLLSWLTDYVSHRDRGRNLEYQRSTRGRLMWMKCKVMLTTLGRLKRFATRILLVLIFLLKTAPVSNVQLLPIS